MLLGNQFSRNDWRSLNLNISASHIIYEHNWIGLNRQIDSIHSIIGKVYGMCWCVLKVCSVQSYVKWQSEHMTTLCRCSETFVFAFAIWLAFQVVAVFLVAFCFERHRHHAVFRFTMTMCPIVTSFGYNSMHSISRVNRKLIEFIFFLHFSQWRSTNNTQSAASLALARSLSLSHSLSPYVRDVCWFADFFEKAKQQQRTISENRLKLFSPRIARFDSLSVLPRLNTNWSIEITIQNRRS